MEMFIEFPRVSFASNNPSLLDHCLKNKVRSLDGDGGSSGDDDGDGNNSAWQATTANRALTPNCPHYSCDGNEEVGSTLSYSA